MAASRFGTSNRALLLGATFVFWTVCLVGRLYYLQVIKYLDLLGRAQRQQQRTIEIAPERGTICDRHGYPLAMSMAVDSVYAVPAEIPDHRLIANLLAPVLGLGESELAARFDIVLGFTPRDEAVQP